MVQQTACRACALLFHPRVSEPNQSIYLSGFARRVVIAGSIILLLLGLTALLWYAPQVFLLAFAAVLLAIFLQGLAMLLCRYTPFPYALCLAIVVLVLTAMAAGVGALIGPNFATQLTTLIDIIPSSLANLHHRLSQYAWGQELLQYAPDFAPSAQRLLGRVTDLFSAMLGAMATLLLVLITGLYLAIHPDRYIEGLIKLAPRSHRDRARQVLAAEGHALRRWLAGRIVSMLVVGILTTIGLWILGVPLPLSLGVLAGVLTFVPYLGPIMSFVPALLVALLDGSGQVAWVAVLYAGVQLVESYFITPMVEARAVSIPPALLILLQLLMGTLLGFTGIIVATPLAVAIIVPIQMLYIQDVLGDDVTPLGQ